MTVVFKYRSRQLTDPDVTFVRDLIAQHPTASRLRLSVLLCEAWQWVQPNGVPCDRVCRSLMLTVGLTTGRGHKDQTKKPNRPLKEILVYPLSKQFRRYLCPL